MLEKPASVEELLSRCEQIAGLSLGELATQLKTKLPVDLKKQKGFVGQLIEVALGADGGNLAQADFAHLGIELKTLPIDFNGRVLESTYVCVVDLNPTTYIAFEQSLLYNKLAHVLWVPVAREKQRPLAEAVLGQPFLWQPSPLQKQILQQDWEHAMELVSSGRISELNARQGQYLQVRPKAAHSRVLTRASDETGAKQVTLPRGFYLRSEFTQQLLDAHLLR